MKNIALAAASAFAILGLSACAEEPAEDVVVLETETAAPVVTDPAMTDPAMVDPALTDPAMTDPAMTEEGVMTEETM